MSKSKKCPTPYKHAHTTQNQAQRHLNGLWALGGHAGAGSQHVYKCQCGSWHVGGRRKKPRRRR